MPGVSAGKGKQAGSLSYTKRLELQVAELQQQLNETSQLLRSQGWELPKLKHQVQKGNTRAVPKPAESSAGKSKGWVAKAVPTPISVAPAPPAVQPSSPVYGPNSPVYTQPTTPECKSKPEVGVNIEEKYASDAEQSDLEVRVVAPSDSVDEKFRSRIRSKQLEKKKKQARGLFRRPKIIKASDLPPPIKPVSKRRPLLQ